MHYESRLKIQGEFILQLIYVHVWTQVNWIHWYMHSSFLTLFDTDLKPWKISCNQFVFGGIIAYMLWRSLFCKIKIFMWSSVTSRTTGLVPTIKCAACLVHKYESSCQYACRTTYLIKGESPYDWTKLRNNGCVAMQTVTHLAQSVTTVRTNNKRSNSLCNLIRAVCHLVKLVSMSCLVDNMIMKYAISKLIIFRNHSSHFHFIMKYYSMTYMYTLQFPIRQIRLWCQKIVLKHFVVTKFLLSKMCIDELKNNIYYRFYENCNDYGYVDCVGYFKIKNYS